MTWINPIFDRNEKDINNLIELKELLLSKKWEDITEAEFKEFATSKGALNDFDLNRIESNTKFINEVLIKDGWTDVLLVSKTQWNVYSFDNINAVNEFERIRSNVIKLIDVYDEITYEDVPDDMMPVDYEKINAIENALFEIKEMIEFMLIPVRYAGEEYAFDRNF